jgi:hypothetical protein
MTRPRNTVARWLGGLGLAALAAGLAAAEPAIAARHARIYLESQAVYLRQPTNAEAAWQFARACFDCSESATNTARRAEFARQGIAAARASLAARADLAAAHYYLGMNLGVLADATRTLGGLRLVSEMERSFKKARELEERFDYAGPDRCLGLLYRGAPVWPISVGNRAKARQHLERARQLAGDYPENQLNLLDSWLQWGERSKAVAELETVEQALAGARRKLTGEPWASDWSHWDQLWNEIQIQAGKADRADFQHKGSR